MKTQSVLLPSDYNMSLEECSQELGCSRERVRQLQNSGLAKLKVALEARGLTATSLDDFMADGPALYDVNASAPVLKYRE